MTKDEYIKKFRETVREEFTTDNEYLCMLDAGIAKEMHEVLQWHFGLTEKEADEIFREEQLKGCKEFSFRKK